MCTLLFCSSALSGWVSSPTRAGLSCAVRRLTWQCSAALMVGTTSVFDWAPQNVQVIVLRSRLNFCHYHIRLCAAFLHKFLLCIPMFAKMTNTESRNLFKGITIYVFTGEKIKDAGAAMAPWDAVWISVGRGLGLRSCLSHTNGPWYHHENCPFTAADATGGLYIWILLILSLGVFINRCLQVVGWRGANRKHYKVLCCPCNAMHIPTAWLFFLKALQHHFLRETAPVCTACFFLQRKNESEIAAISGPHKTPIIPLYIL